MRFSRHTSAAIDLHQLILTNASMLYRSDTGFRIIVSGERIPLIGMKYTAYLIQPVAQEPNDREFNIVNVGSPWPTRKLALQSLSAFMEVELHEVIHNHPILSQQQRSIKQNRPTGPLAALEDL